MRIAGAAATATTLFPRAEQRVAAGRFDTVEQTLDCIDIAVFNFA